MFNFLYKPLVIFIGLMLLLSPLMASDALRETRLAFEIKRTLGQGNVISLDANNQTFLSIYEETSLPIKQGGVILLHDIDSNPNAPLIINPLRTDLLDSGWDTLSIQMPVSTGSSQPEDYVDLIPEAFARIDAAINFFKKKNNLNLTIIAHGMGSTMAANYLNQSSESTIRAFIAIGMDSSKTQIKQNLERLTLPILDLFGTQDLNSVLKTAKDRKRAIMLKAKNLHYRQVRLEGADHFFSGLNPVLVNIVSSWLAKNATGTEINFSKKEP